MQQNENVYQNIMRALVWRYVAAQHRKQDESAVTEDDINEVKTEISAMRYEFLELFGRNGMDVSSASRKEKPVRAKRTKIWERRLMRDFHVAPVPADSEKQENEDENQTHLDDSHSTNEDPKSKFRRIARQIANDSIAHKWTEVIRGVTKNSQIGRCHDKESFRNQQNLLKAIEEAKRLVLRSPPPCLENEVQFIDDASTTLIDLLSQISAEVGGNNHFNSTIKKSVKPNQSNQKFAFQAKQQVESATVQQKQQKPFQQSKSPQPVSPSTSKKVIKSPDKLRNKSPIPDNHRPISPPPMFSNKHSPHPVFDKVEKKPQQGRNSPDKIQKPQNLPEIKVTKADNQQILNPTNLITLKAPPGKAKKIAPPVPPSNDISRIIIKRPRSPVPNQLRKCDSVPETFDAPITFLSLNDSTEKLVPRSCSPESDTSTLPPNSPRLTERIPDVQMVKRKAGWL